MAGGPPIWYSIGCVAAAADAGTVPTLLVVFDGLLDIVAALAVTVVAEIRMRITIEQASDLLGE